MPNKILNDINHEKYLPGAQIPTELELQRSTGYSRSTVRHALRILVNKGVLVKIHGKGTFVQDGTSNETTRSQFFSLTSNVENWGGVNHYQAGGSSTHRSVQGTSRIFRY